MGIDSLKLAWCIGYLDGEGYFGTTKTGGCDVEVASTNPHPLFRLRECFGLGTVKVYPSRRPKQRTYFKWRCNGQDAMYVAQVCLSTGLLVNKKLGAYAVANLKKWPANSATRQSMVTAAQHERRLEYNGDCSLRR